MKFYYQILINHWDIGVKNNLNPPPKKKSPSQIFKPNATKITMAADDATMKLISGIHDFSTQNPFQRLLKS